jgi:hypothetical protein
MSPISEAEREEALSAIQAANRRMADRAKAPGYYHATLGLLGGGAVAVQEAPWPWRLAYYAVLIVAMALLVRAYRRKTGLWISGYRAGRTRWVAVGVAAIFVLVAAGAIWLTFQEHVHGACLVAGVLIAGLVTAAGYLWERAYRRDLGVA